MKAMILAAGRGERMRPLTDHLPKPLLAAGGRCLIEWQVERLVRAGFRELVVNVSHLGALIEDRLGDGRRYGARIAYSREPEALETAGGIARALPLLGARAFVAVNADIYCDYDYAGLWPVLRTLESNATERLARLVLVSNPTHHPAGDFALDASGLVAAAASGRRYTFSGIGLYRAELFAAIRPGTRCALGPLLRAHVEAGRVEGEYFGGRWLDVGTPERLALLRHWLGDDGPQ